MPIPWASYGGVKLGPLLESGGLPCPALCPCSLRMTVLRVTPEMLKPHRKRKTR